MNKTTNKMKTVINTLISQLSQVLKSTFHILIFSFFIVQAPTTQAEGLNVKLLEASEELMFPGYADEFSKLINMIQLTHDVAYNLSTNEISDSCKVMMNSNFALGPVGQYISHTMLSNPSLFKPLFQGASLNNYCPQYSKMNEKQRAQVWVLIMTSMTFFESSCNPKVAAKGPNGTAYGYFQLHKGYEDQYDGTTNVCKKGDAGDPYKASKCALGMMVKQFDRDSGELFSNRSYWDVLRPNGSSQKARLIRKALYNSSLCNPKTL